MSLPTYVQDHLQGWICGGIAVLGLAIYGFTDLLRLSIGRIWAISGVCFAESVRRKIWLITPLAIIGVIIVAQLQRPNDERDAIRQTITFCLFATGMLVSITAIILACTNLPREIENRVIYTIVTKPTTRLEIVLGKIIGFARVAALILLIMGLFTFGYLHWRAWRFESGIRDRLAMPGEVDAVSRPTLEYYRDAGLLTARDMAFTPDVEVYGRLPEAGDPRRFMPDMADGSILVPFEVLPTDLLPPGVPSSANIQPGISGLVVRVKMGAQKIPGYVSPSPQSNLPPTIAAPTTQANNYLPPPAIAVQFLDDNSSDIFPSRDINNGQPFLLTDLDGKKPLNVLIPPASAQLIYKPGSGMDKPLRFSVRINGVVPGWDYFVDPDPLEVVVVPVQGHDPRKLLPMTDPRVGKPAQPIFHGREGTAGQQIRGGEHAPVAVYRFSGEAPADSNGDLTFEFKTNVERNSDYSEAGDNSTHVTFTAFDRDTNQESPPVKMALESSRLSYFRMPAKFVQSGNFDIRIRCDSNEQYLGLLTDSLGMVRAVEGFDFNLIKSLTIMWLMAILVITIAIFTSTFLSWPTAIVLTLLILLGRWGIEQLGDATQPGIGNLIATDMGFTDPNKAKVVSSMAEALAGGLNVLAKVLPDFSQFAATEDIERGLVVPVDKLAAAMEVLLCYGLATLALAYVRLTWVEVAP
ncbi:MAG TPA: ABC transporter permease subunit [Tepidisphaeraceae bacterium]|jgi:ABC-type transport system involved in multi-copper enzyme maturation permease subunit|nr:ABC transporter permease subunit [Tepidisphaeraceae bacterium]